MLVSIFGSALTITLAGSIAETKHCWYHLLTHYLESQKATNKDWGE
jgi:hypothetical protein